MDKRVFNVKPSPLDTRDYLIERTLDVADYPSEIDLRQWDSPVDDQGYLGSCSSNAVVNTYENMLNHFYPSRFKNLSRLFLYYHTRRLENTIAEDSGVFYIRNVMKAVKLYGICSEDVWPYNEDDVSTTPTSESYIDAATRKINTYNILFTMSEMIEALASYRPIVIGMDIFDDFLYVTKENPVVPMPVQFQQSYGGHSVSVVGVSMDKQQFLAKNSFGASWGMDGYCWIPFEYMRKYAFEKWCFEIENQDTVLLT